MDLNQQKILQYSLDESSRLSQLKKASAVEIDSEKAECLSRWMEKAGVMGFSQNMDHYPFKLRQVKYAPYIVYAIGNIDLLSQSMLWIVGPRQMSPYAQEIMQAFFAAADGYSFVTISGMARGVDQLCHQLSLNSQIPTIAVLGGGLRWALWSFGRKMIKQIVDAGGLVLSEFRLDFVPTKRSFPQRNRLIAGLCEALFVPEAQEGSWSLITVDFALQQKKSVFVAPNSLFSRNGKGTNDLAAQGSAVLLSDFSQILGLFSSEKGRPRGGSKECVLTSEEREMLQLIALSSGEEVSNWISRFSGEYGEALSLLTQLEMKHVVGQQWVGFYYVK